MGYTGWVRADDLAHDTELAAGVRHSGGEPRAPQLYCEPGAVGELCQHGVFHGHRHR